MRGLTIFTGFIASAIVFVGCVDPEGDYSDFTDRYNSINGQGGAAGGGGQGGADAGPCTVPKAGELDGEYFFALAASTNKSKVSPKKPIALLTTVTSKDNGGALQMEWNMQPLKWEDRTTPIGDPIKLVADVAADGTFDIDPAPLDLVGEANPLSHSPLTADISSLAGKVCDLDGFYCGTIDGDVSKPIPLSIDGSTWTMVKVTGGSYPEPPTINCKKDLADPLPIQ
ncbi:MAG: hypothetical protein R3B13_00405 [Polyangiaceae bacterium]